MRKKGFTLIEMLVVIAIIGILASIVIVNVSEARKRARDGRRVADLEAMQTALELYYDKNKYYPTSTVQIPLYITTSYACTSSTSSCWSNLIPTTFLQSMPQDPAQKDSGAFCSQDEAVTQDISRGYLYWIPTLTKPQKYALVTKLEEKDTTSPLRDASINESCFFGNYIIKGGNW